MSLRVAAALIVPIILLSGCSTPPSYDAPPAQDPDLRWPEVHEAVIRPGVGIGTLEPGTVPALDSLFGPSVCTANFVFQSLDNQTLYLGTASHCLVGLSIGDHVALADGAAHATIAYCSWGAMDRSDTCTDHADQDGVAWWNDFALLRIDDEYRHLVHPAMLGFGGPVGITRDAETGQRVLSYGNSSYHHASGAVNPREGYVWSHSEWITEVQFLPPGIPGDSGSAVLLADGRALGSLKYLVGVVEPKPVTNGVVNLAPALQAAHEHGHDVELSTWTLFHEGDLPTPIPIPTPVPKSIFQQHTFATT